MVVVKVDGLTAPPVLRYAQVAPSLTGASGFAHRPVAGAAEVLAGTDVFVGAAVLAGMAVSV